MNKDQHCRCAASESDRRDDAKSIYRPAGRATRSGGTNTSFRLGVTTLLPASIITRAR
jgi:hypothetical protein